jgi:hypothetical protein
MLASRLRATMNPRTGMEIKASTYVGVAWRRTGLRERERGVLSLVPEALGAGIERRQHQRQYVERNA